MGVAGLVLVLIAVVLFLAGIFGGGDGEVRLDLGVGHVDLTATETFLLGVVATVLLFLGLVTIRSGMRRARERRKDLKRVDQLSAQLDRAKKEAGIEEDEERPDKPDAPTPI